MEDPLIGVALDDRYLLERFVAEGGMARVYAARQTVLDRICAVKVLVPELARREETVERFLREAKTAASLRHPNVVDVFDFGVTAAGQVYLAMEYLDGHVLQNEIEAVGPLPWARIRSITRQVCEALAMAHARGVIHRDVKPGNVFLETTPNGEDCVKVIDFGLARQVTLSEPGARRLTKTGVVFGTPDYMSPEQACGQDADHRADIYALGCVIYEMVTGKVPFCASSFLGVLQQHVYTPVPPLPETLPDRPARLDAFLLRLLAKDAAQRPSSIEEVLRALDDLEAVAESPAPEPVHAPEPTGEPVFVAAGASGPLKDASIVAAAPPAPLPRQAGLGRTLGTVVAVAALGVALTVFAMTRRPPRAPAPAQAPASVAIAPSPTPPVGPPTRAPTPTIAEEEAPTPVDERPRPARRAAHPNAPVTAASAAPQPASTASAPHGTPGSCNEKSSSRSTDEPISKVTTDLKDPWGAR